VLKIRETSRNDKINTKLYHIEKKIEEINKRLNDILFILSSQ